MDPSLGENLTLKAMDLFKKLGFCGFRFNPSTFEGGINSKLGKVLFAHAGELGMPIGFMCFKGITTEIIDALSNLMKESPKTVIIIDHMGFFRQAGVVKEELFQNLLNLSKISLVISSTTTFYLRIDDYYYKVCNNFRYKSELFAAL